MDAMRAAGQSPQVANPLTALRRVPSFGQLVSRLARAMGIAPTKLDHPDIRALLTEHRKHHKAVDEDRVRYAYLVAEQFHRGQMRKSGDPYITHPVAVATILARLGMDSTTIIAALLHDTVEDTRYTLAQLHNDFGDEVAHLVDGVTKLEKVHFGGVAEAETTRKMILAAGRDVRVLLIKLADRLHNMRTLGAKSGPSRTRIAKVTRDILVPLAGRLGVQVLKRELEDLAFAVLEPEAHAAINALVLQRAVQRQAQVATVMRALVTKMRAERIGVRVIDRPRHYTSIYERHAQNTLPERLVDDPRVVIVVRGDAADCYAALGVVHSMWRPVPGRFKDFIASAKFNLYKSLHTTVIGPQEQPLDVMIRTEEMHKVAEYGISAVHSGHSHADGRECGGCWASESAELEWLRHVLDWQHEATSGAFLESLRYGLADHEIVVFSADGETISLPVDATPVDVAYALDTSLGDRCVGARVNGALAALSSTLADGDVVEILRSPSAYTGPEREWLMSVRSPRAQLHIKRWFDEQDAQAPSDGADTERKRGRDALGAALLSRERFLAHAQPLVAVARAFGFAGTDGLYVALARGDVCPEKVADRLIAMVDGAVL